MTVSAQVVAHSISPEGIPIFSVQVTAHRFILAEINTHRMLSHSYRSSRAVPSARLIEEVRTTPAMPVFWGANQPGMQASAELDDEDAIHQWRDVARVGLTQSWNTDGLTRRGITKELWEIAAENAADLAEMMVAEGLHKQIANRVLEPFLWVHGIITATEWDNFFGLRLHKSAQPEFRALADEMWKVMRASEPKHLAPGQWHLPYTDNIPDDEMAAVYEAAHGDPKRIADLAIKISVARCARSSYKSFDTDKRSTLAEDLATYAKLNIPGTDQYDPTQPIHASPAEHQAMPDTCMSSGRTAIWGHERLWGNFQGWIQYRKTLKGEACAPTPEGYDVRQ